MLALDACLLTLGACKRDAPTAPPAPPLTSLGDVSVRDLTPPREAPAHVDVEALGRALRTRLLATGQFAADVADAGSARAITRVEVQLAVDGAEVDRKGLARVRVLVRMETRPSEAPGAISERLEGAGEQPYEVLHPDHTARLGHAAHPSKLDKGALEQPKEPLYEGLVERVAGDLLTGFANGRRLHQGPATAVHAALVTDGGELRLEAIRAAGERRLASESPTLLKLLDDPDEPTRDAALGALIALGDRRAVTALTHSRSMRDRRELRKIIEAISILGGQEADDYLSFVAGSHDDEEIRAEATAARARLLRRAEAGAKPP